MGMHVQTMADRWQRLFVCVLFVLITQVHGQNNIIRITLVDDAVQKGAVCIDGSPSGYYYDAGFGDGVNNWLVYLMGGGWCGSFCRDRHTGRQQSGLGSTRKAPDLTFPEILSSNHSTNPDFYNWNRVFVHYCDGSCFLGDNEVYDSTVKAKFQLRGSRIYNAVMDELLAKGMKNANNAILMGTSAGGLATMLHCDGFRALLPYASRVKCISDSGFFIRGKDLPGAQWREDEYDDVVKVHNLTSFLPISCTSRMKPGLCLFGENLVGDIKTPLFLLNSAFDSFEIQYELRPDDDNLKHGWDNCKDKFPTSKKCTADQKQLIKDFRNAYLETLKGIPNNPSRGLFINSCFEHIFTFFPKGLWNSNGLAKLENKTISQAIGDWYFDRSSVQLIDTQADFALNCSSS